MDIVVADHVQGVMKTNFMASWDEIGDDCEMEDTYALTTMKSLEGELLHVFPSISVHCPFQGLIHASKGIPDFHYDKRICRGSRLK